MQEETGGEMARVLSDQPERENAFGHSCVRLHKSMGLTQRALGRLLGISGQAIRRWERGVQTPKPEHLERLLALCLQRHAFEPGLVLATGRTLNTLLKNASDS
jgi:transcriptional regulator with XRE-family HTH domain